MWRGPESTLYHPATSVRWSLERDFTVRVDSGGPHAHTSRNYPQNSGTVAPLNMWMPDNYCFLKSCINGAIIHYALRVVFYGSCRIFFFFATVRCELEMFELKKLIIVLLLLLPLSIPMGVHALAPTVTDNKQALIISPLDETVPFGSRGAALTKMLKNAGYNITEFADGAVKVDFLLANLNNYSVVIWRTNTYAQGHVVYWYVGEHVSNELQQERASDFATGLLNAHAGILGMSPDFIPHYFKAGSLSNVKLLIFLASYGASIAPELLKAGVTTVIFNNGVVSLQSGLIDDLTISIVGNLLVGGQDVQAAVYTTLSPVNQGQQPTDNYDTTYAPPFWFIGDGTLTI